DSQLRLGAAQLNIPAGGTTLLNVSADRRGFDGPIRLTMPGVPKGVRVEGGVIPREYLDASNTRTVNRRGVLLVTAEQDVKLDTRELQVWGEGTLSDGTVLRRRARGTGVSIDV